MALEPPGPSSALPLPWDRRLSPDLVVELASASDEGPRSISALRQTMATYRANGAQLGWLLLPEERAVEIWRVSEPNPERLDDATTLEGGELFPGLALDLAPIWEV
ncbi:Uma2 family endonuclease [Vulcanococcus limneticus]|uniref:Uma2 family endonuclease n=1 Tax=Vulcanococcus limneticus TaxID=2170428 RepID=UPI00398C173D